MGCTSNQDPDPPFFVTAPTAMASGAQVQNHWTPVQAGVGQANTYQETRGGRYIDQMQFDHCSPPVSDTSVYSLQSFLPGHNAPMTYMSGIPSVESHSAQDFHQWISCTRQQSSSRNDPSILWSTTTQPSLPDSVMPIEDASFIDTSFTREETGSKETPFSTKVCPFPKCRKKCGRPQELERHIREHHLPYYIYCGQHGCTWTGSRRYALRYHLTHKHKGIQMPSKLDAFIIYDARGLVKQLLSKEINVEQAVSSAQLLFYEKAVQLGRLGVRRWMRGLKVNCIFT